MLDTAILVAGFALLIKGADLLVEGAAAVARRFKVSELAIGLTVVAFGTSSPELFVNVLAGIRGTTDIAVGNVLGSNIANSMLILGASAAFVPLAVSPGTVWKEIPFSLLAALVFGVMANDRMFDGAARSVLTRTDGLVLLGFFAIFLYYSATIAQQVDGTAEQVPDRHLPPARSILYILLGLAGLVLGGRWIVDGAVAIAAHFGLGQTAIGLTVVAVGTSLPELATSLVAVHKKNVDIAVGNVVGSNIFNIFFVLGVSAVITPLPFDEAANADILVMVGASLLIFVTMFTGRRRTLDRWEGAVLLAAYVSYTVAVLTR